MTPDRTPAPTPHTPTGGAPATATTVPEFLYVLDPAAALTADLDALPRPPGAPPARLHADAVLWLALVNSLATLTRLPPGRRPAYLRRARVLWADAAARWDAPRYAALGERLARWRRGDPTLALVRELLWAVEQLESIGGVRLAYSALMLVAALVPAGSRRAGYVLAQSGRPLRTLGALDAALARYAAGLRIGRTHHEARVTRATVRRAYRSGHSGRVALYAGASQGGQLRAAGATLQRAGVVSCGRM